MEFQDKIDNLSGTDIKFDNSYSGYTATNIQEAIDSTSGRINKLNVGHTGDIIGFDANVLNVMKNSFNSAANYTLYSGQTTNASEGGWYGFKHKADKSSYGIYFGSSYGALIFYRDASGNYTFYRAFSK